MTTRSYLLGLTAAAILVAPAAQAASVKEIFEEYNLLGIWAWDCSKPASNSTGTVCSAITAPSAVAECVSVRTSHACAVICIQVPIREMSCPLKNSWKLR